MRNVKILATCLRVFAVISALFTAYLFARPYLDYPSDGRSFDWIIDIASAIVAALTIPLLIFTAAYLLESLEDFKHQTLERLNPEKNEDSR